MGLENLFWIYKTSTEGFHFGLKAYYAPDEFIEPIVTGTLKKGASISSKDMICW